MTIKNKFTYKLTDRRGTIAVVPLGESDFTIDWSRGNDETNFDYEKELSGKLTFVGEAFQRLMNFESSMYRCEEQRIEIFYNCNSGEKLIFSGKISLNDAEFNLDKCWIVMKFSKSDKNDCFDFNKNEKVNLFQLIYNRIKVKTSIVGGGTFETKSCIQIISHVDGTQQIGGDYWCESGDPYQMNWVVFRRFEEFSGTPSDPNDPSQQIDVMYQNRSEWVREIVELPCSEIPPSGWVLIENNCSTTGVNKYAKKPSLYNCKNTNQYLDENNYSYQTECQVVGMNIVNGENKNEIDNGMLFNSVLVELLKSVCPNLTLKSDFFQINPDVVTDINYVTGQRSTTDQILIFQKSDVKRPYVSGNASKLEVTFEKILEVLSDLFNVKWRIDGNVFRLEHVSWWSKTIGIDVTSDDLKKFFVGRRVYSYQNEKIPKKEIFKFKEQSMNEAWKGEIEYKNCVSKGKKNEETKFVDGMTTDIQFVLDNPDAESNKVEDDGFVLISSRKVGDDYYVNSEQINQTMSLNNVFGWSILIRDFLGYERPLKEGKLNGVDHVFQSAIPTKKGEKFAIPFPICGQTFVPDDIVKTSLGNGIVNSASFRFKDCFLELDLLYNANENLWTNESPILSGGGNFWTYADTPKTISFTANDPDGTIPSVQVQIQPTHGNVTIDQHNQNLTFVPNSGFVGWTSFSIVAFDNYNEISNVVPYIIEVKPQNQPPVANDETFNVYHGETFNQPLSILSNDTDDNGFTLATTNVTTQQGVAVTINSNGFFQYTPPTNFEGQDWFEYTITDGTFTDVGRVNLNVMFKNKPMAVSDEYQTKKNVSLSIDGTSLGQKSLISNDYTPDGQSYVYTALSETKTTEKGGQVTIQSNGLFTYTPPTNFTGQDSFQYQVNNVNGSGFGLVKIQVIPTIYVKLVESDFKHQYRFNVCGEPPVQQVGGIVWEKDLTLQFFLDSAGTQPIDVTGLNFKVFLKESISINNQTPNETISQSGYLTGSNYLLYNDFIFSDEITDCNGVTINVKKSIEVVSNPTYEII